MGERKRLHSLPTVSSDDPIGVFHSSELDPAMHAEGLYIDAFVSPVIGCVVGPYEFGESRDRPLSS